MRSLLAEALADVELTLVDMEAGLEHLSRSGGTLAHADVLLVVCEPTRKSVLTAARTAALAAELGIPEVLAVGNKARTPQDVEYFSETLAAEGIALAGVLPYDAEVAAADRAGAVGLSDVAPAVQTALDEVLDALEAVQQRSARAGG